MYVSLEADSNYQYRGTKRNGCFIFTRNMTNNTDILKGARLVDAGDSNELNPNAELEEGSSEYSFERTNFCSPNLECIKYCAVKIRNPHEI